jgi:hypothetical protein
MSYWERQRLLDHLERWEVFGPLLDTCLEEYGKSCRLVKYSQMFKEWTLGERDSKTATRYFQGGLISEPDSGIKGRLQEYINYIAEQETKSEYSESHDEKSELPLHPVLEQIAATKTSPIRKWINGKFKCCSLPRLIKAYDKIKEDLTPSLIRDYLVKNNGEPYSDKDIEKEMALNGIPRK